MMDSGLSSGNVTKYKILASCMHAGARIIELSISDAECEFRVLACVTIHKSMCYACDVQPGEGEGKRVVVSTSFYDRLLCVWRFDSKAEI